MDSITPNSTLQETVQTQPAQSPSVKKPWFRKVFKIVGVFFGLLGLLFLVLVVYFVIFPTNTEQDILNTIKRDISPSVVKIVCADKDNNMRVGAGLYYITNDTSEPYVETNAHVVVADDGKYYGCSVFFPREDGSMYDSMYETGVPYIYSESSKIMNGIKANGIDYAKMSLHLSTTSSEVKYPFPPIQKNPYDAISEMCGNSGSPLIQMGSKIYLIGYPGIGGDSQTLTEGVVSGFVGDNYKWIKVSAIANHGNSGGIAIGASDGCNYGILTSITESAGPNLSYVLRSGYIRDFESGSSTGSTYPSYISNSTSSPESFLTRKYDFGDLTVRYSDEFELSTSSPNKEGDYAVWFDSPEETAIDAYSEYFSVDVFPHSTDTDLNNLLSSREKKLKYYDTNNKGGEWVYVNGVRANEVDHYIDATKLDSNDIIGGYSLIFQYKGTLYSMNGRYLEGTDNSSKYEKLFKAMIHSIKFE